MLLENICIQKYISQNFKRRTNRQPYPLTISRSLCIQHMSWSRLLPYPKPKLSNTNNNNKKFMCTAKFRFTNFAFVVVQSVAVYTSMRRLARLPNKFMQKWKVGHIIHIVHKYHILWRNAFFSIHTMPQSQSQQVYVYRTKVSWAG